MISNFFRDLQTAAYNLTDTEVANMEGKVVKTVPKALKALWSSMRSDGTAEYSDYYEEFRKAGGMTGWAQHYDSIDKQMKSIKRGLMWRGKPGAKQIAKLGQFIGDYNSIVENGVRLATYITARDKGLSIEKAARMAKEVTVDFNRKGEWGTAANALYLFYNASVQGSARLLRAALNPKNKRLHKMMLGTVAFAAALDAWNRAMSDDEEDEKSGYDKIPSHVKDRNLILWNSFSDSGPDYFKIPLPWGYNVLHVLGQELGTAAHAAAGGVMGYSPVKSATRIIASAADAFNPMSDGSLLQTVSPTVLDPLVRVRENKDWHGGPLFPDYNKAAPDYTKFYGNAREGSKQITEWLAEVTRDSGTMKSAVDVSPETVDMLWDFVTGSAGRVAADTVGFSRSLLSDKPMELNEIPMVRKVVGEVGDSARKTEFYEAFYSIEDIRSELSRVRRDEPARYREALEGIGRRRLLIGFTKSTKSWMNRLKKAMREAERRGNEEAALRYEERLETLMEKYVKRYNAVMYR